MRGIADLFVPLFAHYLVLLYRLSLPRIQSLCRRCYWIFESYFSKQEFEHLENCHLCEPIQGMTAWRQDGDVQMPGAVVNAKGTKGGNNHFRNSRHSGHT